MKDSFRRIFSLTGIIGLLAFSVVTIQQVSKVCESGQVNCLAAAVTFGVTQYPSEPVVLMDMNTAAPTTITASDNVPSMASFIMMLVQATSVYLILISVMVLVFLELLELRYLRKIFQAKTA